MAESFLQDKRQSPEAGLKQAFLAGFEDNIVLQVIEQWNNNGKKVHFGKGSKEASRPSSIHI